MEINKVYRTDIDGLRALAILFVLIFHAFPKAILQGGYIGVDIFFVISGFLITTIISSEIINNKFSLANFYIRRIKRIFPALITILLILSLFSWYALFAEELKVYGKNLIGASTFSSNFILNGDSGYFDFSNNKKPLLHLWSLSIEEQFYILWPVFIIFVLKTSRPLFMIASLLIASFIFQFYEEKHDLISTFYLPWFRFWELMIGGLLVFLPIKLKRLFSNKGIFNEISSSIGLGLIFLGGLFFCVNSKSNFNILTFPVLGTSLIILGGNSSKLSKYVLSSKPMVYLGLISYPLYLWHWPILSLDKIIFNSEFSFVRQILLLAISVFLALLTFRWIEKPLRHSTNKYVGHNSLIAILILLGFIGWRFYDRNGYPHRSGVFIVKNSGDIGHDIFLNKLKENYFLCTPNYIAKNIKKHKETPLCYQSKETTIKDIAIIGDSHAQQLFPGLANKLPSSNVVYYLDQLENNLSDNEILNYLGNDKNIKTVIINFYWAKKLDQSQALGFKEPLTKTIIFLKNHGKKIIITDDIPSFSFQADECKYIRLFGRNKCSENNYFSDLYSQYYPVLNKISMDYNITLIHTSKYFCTKNDCNMNRENKIFFRDDNHLNIEGSEFLAEKITAQIDN